MIRLYLVRHGQTLSNVWNLIQGWSDTPLTNLGIQQAKQSAKLLENISCLSIYSSTSERAYDTACFINQYHQLPIQLTKGLKEMNFGNFEAHPEHIVGGDPAYRINYDWHKFGGETIDDLTIRVGKALEEIVRSHQDENGNIICVTHSIAILAAIRYINRELFETRMARGEVIDNCSVTILEWNNQEFQVKKINITAKKELDSFSK